MPSWRTPSDVIDAVQRLRATAQNAGNLKTNEQQKVIGRAGSPQQSHQDRAAQPQTVYVPAYNPAVVYGPWLYPYYPPYYWPPPIRVLRRRGARDGHCWGVAIGVGSALWGGCNWGGGDVNINVNKYNNINRNSQISNSNWQHNADNRKGAPYRDQASRESSTTAKLAQMAARTSAEIPMDVTAIGRAPIRRCATGALTPAPLHVTEPVIALETAPVIEPVIALATAPVTERVIAVAWVVAARVTAAAPAAQARARATWIEAAEVSIAPRRRQATWIAAAAVSTALHRRLAIVTAPFRVPVTRHRRVSRTIVEARARAQAEAVVLPHRAHRVAERRAAVVAEDAVVAAAVGAAVGGARSDDDEIDPLFLPEFTHEPNGTADETEIRCCHCSACDFAAVALDGLGAEGLCDARGRRQCVH